MNGETVGLKKLLDEHPFTHGLPEDDLEQLAAVAHVQDFEPGAYLLREGRVIDSFYLIISGHAAVELYLPERGVLRLQTLGPGDVAGWSWALPSRKASFDIRAIDKVTAVVLDAQALVDLFASDCGLGYRFLQKLLGVVAERVRAARLQLLDMYAAPVGGMQ